MSSSKIILLVGPAGSGKTTLGQRIAQNSGWIHLSEDDAWIKTGQNPNHRTPEGFAHVEPYAVQQILANINQGRNVVFDFLAYEDPPVNISSYCIALKKAGIPFTIRVLRPSVEVLLARQKQRGRETETDMAVQQQHAEHQVKCLHSQLIRPEWVIDTSKQSLEETYRRYFSMWVENKGNSITFSL